MAVHYLKLIDFTFGGRLHSVTATGQRGLVGAADSDTWDSVQMRVVYHYPDGREAAFDIHTSWVTPDNFPGYVEQEVQFRFDNGVWNGHSRRRGVECTIEGKTPLERKISLNNHYNGRFIEPDGTRSQRGYGIEVLEQFVREVACVEYGGESAGRPQRLAEMRQTQLQRSVGRAAGRGGGPGVGGHPAAAQLRGAGMRGAHQRSGRWAGPPPARKTGSPGPLRAPRVIFEEMAAS